MMPFCNAENCKEDKNFHQKPPQSFTRCPLVLCRERKWKTAQAKKFVKRAAASENNLALRDGVREREEAIKIRKRAAWIGKEVSGLPKHDFGEICLPSLEALHIFVSSLCQGKSTLISHVSVNRSKGHKTFLGGRGRRIQTGENWS